MAAGEDRLPPPQLQLAPPGSFPPSLGPRRAPAFVSLCTALPAHLRRKAAQEAANRAAGWGVWSPQTPCAPLPSPGGALKSTLQ